MSLVIRSFDGLDYSEIITKTVKLNTQPPLDIHFRASRFNDPQE